MRTKTEVQLLNLRQTFREYLNALRLMPVIPLQEYKRIFAKYETCNQILADYRSNHKHRDIA